MFIYVGRNYAVNSDLQRHCDAASSQHVTARSGHTELRTVTGSECRNVSGVQVFLSNYIDINPLN